MDFFRTDYFESLPEFIELVSSANIENCQLIKGKRDAADPKYFVGVGKAEEIRQVVLQQKANVVLFNHNLSPGQGRNLEKLFCCRVIDRTELILDIFAQRARSFEGKLQVELAQLQYLRTRLIRGWTHLERQKGGIGLRGPGETQLETDRRLLDMRIKSIKQRLTKVAVQRQQNQRHRQRNIIPTISLVGYTNAGKSTLFNALSGENIYAADQLFATLDPTLRHIFIPNLGKVILADTVGFIRDLPHDLVAAFKGTLEETVQADLLIHVVDSQHDSRLDLIDSVRQVVHEIGAADIPQLLVFNKIDLDPNCEPKLEFDQWGAPKRVWLSAATGAGFDLLNQAIEVMLQQKKVDTEVVLQPNEGKLRAQLYALEVVKSETMTEEGKIILKVSINNVDYQRLLAGRVSTEEE